MIVHTVYRCDVCPLQFQLSGALLVHKLNSHIDHTPLDISNILAELLTVETLYTSDDSFDYTLKFCTTFQRTPKITIKNEPVTDDRFEDIAGNVNTDADRPDITHIDMMDISTASPYTVKLEDIDNLHEKSIRRCEFVTEGMTLYCCDICGEKYSSYDVVKEHMRAHMDDGCRRFDFASRTDRHTNAYVEQRRKISHCTQSEAVTDRKKRKAEALDYLRTLAMEPPPLSPLSQLCPIQRRTSNPSLPKERQTHIEPTQNSIVPSTEHQPLTDPLYLTPITQLPASTHCIGTSSSSVNQFLDGYQSSQIAHIPVATPMPPTDIGIVTEIDVEPKPQTPPLQFNVAKTSDSPVNHHNNCAIELAAVKETLKVIQNQLKLLIESDPKHNNIGDKIEYDSDFVAPEWPLSTVNEVFELNRNLKSQEYNDQLFVRMKKAFGLGIFNERKSVRSIFENMISYDALIQFSWSGRSSIDSAVRTKHELISLTELTRFIIKMCGNFEAHKIEGEIKYFMKRVPQQYKTFKLKNDLSN